MNTTVLLENNNGIATITINRPEKLNALNHEVFEGLNQAFKQVYTDDAIKAVIITGAGNKAFVAGADISEFANFSTADAKQLASDGQATFFTIENCSKPVVAAVNGFALGGGCELAMACHFRIASTNAKFGQPEVNLGLIPGYGGTQRLTQLIGKGRAIELLISAAVIDAATALQYGLVNHVVPQEELLTKATTLLTQIGTKAPLAVGACIAAANQAFAPDNKGFTVEIDAFGACFETEDMKEGTTAFLEKRAANFQGK